MLLFVVLYVGDVNGMIGVQGALKFNGGGHINHSIFWTNLGPSGGGKPKGRCMCVIVCICIT